MAHSRPAEPESRVWGRPVYVLMRLPGDLDGLQVWWGPTAAPVGEQVDIVNRQVCCGQRSSPLSVWLFFNMCLLRTQVCLPTRLIQEKGHDCLLLCAQCPAQSLTCSRCSLTTRCMNKHTVAQVGCAQQTHPGPKDGVE